MTNCKCGKTAMHIAYIPSDTVYAGLTQVAVPVYVCDYHAEKAMKLGYYVEVIKKMRFKK